MIILANDIECQKTLAATVNSLGDIAELNQDPDEIKRWKRTLDDLRKLD